MKPKVKADLAPSQLDKFKAAARELGTDDDPERFKERVKRIGSVKPDSAREAKPENSATSVRTEGT